MGLFEKSKNITDTELRIVVQESSDPAEALRRHILSLEEASRQLRSSEQFLDRQRKWLESSAERKLGLAEEWEKRAATAVQAGRDDLAKHALQRKKELLRSMGEDRGQVEHIQPQIAQIERRLGEVRQKILKAKAVRARFCEGADPEVPEGGEAPRGGLSTSTGGASGLSDPDLSGEIDEELKDLKRRIAPDGQA